LTFNNVTSTSVGSIFVQGRSLGATTITVQAPGYSDGTSTITVRPSGFVNTSPGGNFATTTFSADTLFRVQPAVLDPTTFNVTAFQALRGGASATVLVTAADLGGTNVGSMTNGSLTFNGGDSFQDTAFHPASVGTSQITVGVPSGFDTPSSQRQIVATVSQATMSIGNQTIGKDLQAQVSLSLNAPAPAGGLVVTLSSADPNVRLSTSGTAQGDGNPIAVTVPQNQTSVGGIFIQSLASAGTVTVTMTANGAATSTNTMTLVPSGFVNTSPGGNFNTTVNAANVLFRVQTARLDPVTLNIVAFQALRGGLGPVNVPLTSSNANVGVLTVNPLAFSGGDSFKDSAFDGLAVGSTNLTVGVPPGFSTPSNQRVITATVN
jgi:hypothetical protein